MKILVLINWKIHRVASIPDDLQPSDYDCPQVPFWFFRYFRSNPSVSVVDISAPRPIEAIEKKIRFHVFQTISVIKNMSNYDLIFVHGTTSAMCLCGLKRLLKLKTPPILDVDISSFHRASTSGLMFRLARFASKEFDFMVFHASSQSDYYRKYFPWLANRMKFIPVGVDHGYWAAKQYLPTENKGRYIVCVGYRKRDWKTLIEAYEVSGIKEKLYLIGNPDLEVQNERIIALPFMSINELMTYVVNAKYSVIPLDDFNYSFGQLTLLQQMTLGVPIIAADVPAIRDYAKASDGVVTYRPYDASDLSNALRRMSNLTLEELSELGRQSVAATCDLLSERHMAEEFESVCKSLVK